MTSNEFSALLTKYGSGTCSADEIALLESWYLKRDVNAITDLTPEDLIADLSLIRSGIVFPEGHQPKKSVKLFSWGRIAAAAVILISISVCYYFISDFKQKSAPQNLFANDIPAGGNQALITLENGKTIPLSSKHHHLNIADGKLSYEDNSKVDAQTATSESLSQILFVSTPPGGTYQFTLPDGTKAWLNAASSLRFPGNFNNSGQRIVELKGEAYFEVFHDNKKPFIVKTKNQELTVLGTHFNINAYDDEPAVRTTLAEGHVLIRRTGIGSAVEGRDYAQLNPGQQSELGQGAIVLKQVDISQFLAWKNGYFHFEENTIPEIMKMVARWYDIDVDYQYKPGNDRYTGIISRSVKISELLHMLEGTKTVKFKVQGRRVTVMN